MYNSYQIPGSFNSSIGSPMYSSMDRPMSSSSDSRLIGGGFFGPFLLGGITGGLVSPFFYGGYGRPRPYYNNYYPPRPYPPRPYPPYRPYYR